MSCIQTFKGLMLKNKCFVSVYTFIVWRLYFKISGAEKKMIQNNFVFSAKNLKSKFYLPNYKKDLIQKAILMSNNYYEKDLLWHLCFLWKEGMLSKMLKNGCVLDIGANIGNHTLFFLNECDVKRVYCFEPIPSTFKILQRNIELNELQHRVSLFNTAVGATEGLAIISHFSEDNLGGTCLSDGKNGTIRVVSIDEIGITEKVSFVKIDVEGFELNVILGMKEFLKKQHPIVFIEIRDKFLNQINEIFIPLGYQREVVENMPGQECANYIYY